MKITVTIQAYKKHCCWCHFCSPDRQAVSGKHRWCSAFVRKLGEDKRGALRLDECKEAQICESTN